MFHDPRQRTTAIAFWLNSFMVGSALGPLLGGFMLEHFWWGSVFLLNVPVMAMLIVLGPFFLPEFRDPNAGRLDILSAALSLISILLIIYGIKQVAQDGLDAVPIAAAMGGLAVAAVFVARQRKLEHPLIDLNLFTVPAFGPGDVNALATAALAIAVVAFADTSALSRVYSSKYRAYVDPNQEMIGLGMAKIAAGFFQGFPISGSTSRTPVAEASGARTQLTGIVGAAAIAFLLPYLTQAGVAFALAQRFYPVSYEIGRLARVLVSGVVATAVALWVVPAMPPLAGLLTRGFTTVAVYLGLLWTTGFLRASEREFLRAMRGRLQRRGGGKAAADAQ